MTPPAPEKPKVIVICGPTGVGKTSIGIELARAFGGEIISADSMQIYRYMDIGTAKPTSEELALIPHHMIDIIDPDEDFDAVQFSDRARPLIAEIEKRNRIPIVVGGTGLYIKSLLYGIFKSESIDPKIRSRLRKDAEQKGSRFMYDRLKQIDPAAAKRLHPNDLYRVIRALETVESTGRPISEHHQSHGFTDSPFYRLKIGLKMDRQKLYRRIDRRADAMIEAGFAGEVKKLLGMGYSAVLKSMQSIGYRHMADFIESRLPWDECLRTLKRDTRRFAKRQFTWFGADREVIWHRPDQLNLIHKLVDEFVGQNRINPNVE
jgi:tRNA dimethylallyltransferase